MGQSKSIDDRFIMHTKGKLGSDWTKLHKPIKILEYRKTKFSEVSEAMVMENSVTVEYMKIFGWRNVRGGDFCTLDEEKLRFLLCLNTDLGIEILPIKNPRNYNLSSTGIFLFVLKLENGNYFIGRTDNLKLAILNEYNGLGSGWTKLHKPVELFSLINILEQKKEKFRHLHNSLVINYMKKFGFKNIRGGDFYKIDSKNHKNKVLNYSDIFN